MRSNSILTGSVVFRQADPLAHPLDVGINAIPGIPKHFPVRHWLSSFPRPEGSLNLLSYLEPFLQIGPLIPDNTSGLTSPYFDKILSAGYPPPALPNRPLHNPLRNDTCEIGLRSPGLPLTSVHWAERMVAIRSSKGLENRRAILGSGISFERILMISSTLF